MIDCPQCGIVVALGHHCPQTYVQKLQAENQRLREMLAEVLGHMEPLAHHAILGPVGSPREWVSEGREMARQAMLNVGRWGVAALASVPGATGESAEDER